MALRGLAFDNNDLWTQLLQGGGQQPFPLDGEIDISSLPPELKRIVEARRSEFNEGNRDKIDTENETRKLLEQAIGQDPQALPNAPGMEALKGLSQAELTQLLIDWIMSKQGGEQNASGGGQNRGSMQPQQFSNVQPANFGGSGGGGTGGGGGAPGGSGGGSPVSAPATGSSGGPPPKAEVMEKAKYAMKYFQDHGLTKAQAAAIVGNMMVESGMDSGNNSGDGGTSGGLCQWHNERRAALQKWARDNGRDWTDFNTQLEYTLLEAKQRGNLEGLSKTDAGAGAAYWDQNFEVSDGSARQQRINNAQMLMNA